MVAVYFVSEGLLRRKHIDVLHKYKKRMINIININH